MSYDPFESEVNYPPHQKSEKEPKYKSVTFIGEIEDDLEDFCKYKFTGNYYEFNGRLQFVESMLSATKIGAWFPVMGISDWLWVLKSAIAEELGIQEDAVIFESKIELK